MQLSRQTRGALYYIVALLLSFTLVRAFGYHAKANNVLNVLGLLLLLLGSGVGALHALAACLLLLAAAYLPFGVIYGKPDFLVISSLLQTNRSESIEFIGQLPWASFLLAAGFGAAGWFFVYRFNRARRKIPLLLAGAVCLLLSLFLFNKQMRTPDGQKEILALDLPRSVAQAAQQYRQEQRAFGANDAAQQWQVQDVDSKYRNYVIVLGESVRRDYMSAYGYAQKTTPFADQAKGVFINGYVAPAPNTFTAVPRTMAEVNGDQVAYGRNLLALARQAGFRTYWLSNQGYVGEYDSPSSRLASSADVVHFSKLSSSLNNQVDDSILLEKLTDGLQEGTGSKRLVVLHLMGSHPVFCDRVKGEEQQFTASSAAMRCYLGSIKRTDSLLAGIHGTLSASGQPFSLIYLGDHGLHHRDKGTPNMTLAHGNHTKQNYAVPFYILSSDATSRRQMDKEMSGSNFLKGAAHWMGIRAAGLPHYDLLAPTPDSDIQVYVGDGYKAYRTLQDDPA
ncbi:phosphoethanolamine transferase [Massilia sp. SR12]